MAAGRRSTSLQWNFQQLALRSESFSDLDYYINHSLIFRYLESTVVTPPLFYFIFFPYSLPWRAGTLWY